MKTIGIYIGAFDPIHSGHLSFAEDALKAHRFDKLYFLIEPTPRHKQGVKSLDHRVNMAILGVAYNPKLGTIVPKSKVSLDSYIKLLQARFSGHRLAIVIPEDYLKRFLNLPSLLSNDFSNIDIIVGLSKSTPDEISLRLKLLSETSGLNFKHTWFRSDNYLVNSREIKKLLKCSVRPKEIPQAVYDYIVKQKLYAAALNA